MKSDNPPELKVVDKQTGKEALQATKWLKVPVLLDSTEMKAMFDELPHFWIFPVSGVSKRSEAIITKEKFLEIYNDYVTALKNGLMPNEQKFRPYFSSVLTTNSESLYAMHVGTDQQLIKVSKPVVQLQIHRFDYSEVDGKFRSMILGPETVFWGIQFSYPQLTQSENYEIVSVNDSPEFPNTHLFKELQRWIRHNTTPTPFVANGQKTNVPIRLGKACYPWINNHPQLIKKGLQVESR